MTWGLIALVAAITFGSRLLGLVATPRLTGRWKDLVEALPAPLFAALAVASVTGATRPLAPTLLGALTGAAVAVLVRRSLLAALIGGAAGFTAGAVVDALASSV